MQVEQQLLARADVDGDTVGQLERIGADARRVDGWRRQRAAESTTPSAWVGAPTIATVWCVPIGAIGRSARIRMSSLTVLRTQRYFSVPAGSVQSLSISE